MENLIKVCTDAIAKIILQHTNAHMQKILGNEMRKREFVCSMLYLMRNGVESRGECILPQIGIISNLLPLENFLPLYFKIRPKSITEGENLLKIELRKQTDF
jgi:hypothetical protein